MRNIDKLVLFLINSDDKVTLSKSTATDLETVDKFSEFIINKILPEDFLIQEGSHVEEKDLNTLVKNYNNLLKEENLKPVLLEAINSLDIRPNQATLLTSNIMPILHSKIKVLMANISKPKEEAKQETNKQEENTKKKEKKKELSFGKKKEKKEEVTETVKENAIEEQQGSTQLEKILMAVVGVLLLVVVGVLIFFLVKVNL